MFGLLFWKKQNFCENFLLPKGENKEGFTLFKGLYKSLYIYWPNLRTYISRMLYLLMFKCFKFNGKILYIGI